MALLTSQLLGSKVYSLQIRGMAYPGGGGGTRSEGWARISAQYAFYPGDCSTDHSLQYEVWCS